MTFKDVEQLLLEIESLDTPSPRLRQIAYALVGHCRWLYSECAALRERTSRFRV